MVTSATISTISMFHSACWAMIFFSTLPLVLSFLWPNSSFSAFSFFFSFRMSQQLKEWNYSPRKQAVEAVDSLSEEL